MATNNTEKDFKALLEAYNDGEYARFLRMSTRLLKRRNNDSMLSDEEKHVLLPFHCAALVATGQYRAVLKMFDNQQDPACLSQRIYALYKLNKFQDARSLLNQLGDHLEPTVKSYLEAQLALKMEDYQLSSNLYHALAQGASQSDEVYDELSTNLVASRTGLAFQHASLANPANDPIDAAASENTSHEYMYNVGCFHLASGRFSEALEYFEQALKRAKSLYESEQLTEREWQRERAPIHVQMAYAYQCTHQWNHALPIYQELLDAHSKGEKLDYPVLVCAINNYLVGRLANMSSDRTTDFYAELTRLNWVSWLKRPDFITKLTCYQRSLIKSNTTLFALQSNKLRIARSFAIGARAIHLRQGYESIKMFHQLEGLCMTFADQKPSTGKIPEEVLKLLHELESKQVMPAMVKFFYSRVLACDEAQLSVALEKAKQALELETNGQRAADVLDHIVHLATKLNQVEAVAASVSKLVSSKPTEVQLKYGLFLLNGMQDGKQAASVFEKLVKQDPSDMPALAGLVMSYSLFDSDRAAQYYQHLEASQQQKPKTSDSTSSEQSIEALEASMVA